MYAGRILRKGFAKKRERLLLELRARGGKGVAGCLYSPSCREGVCSRKPGFRQTQFSETNEEWAVSLSPHLLVR